MAITTYSELQTAAANWLDRTNMTVRIPEFIALAEARINRRLNKVDKEVDTPLIGVVGSRFLTLPTNFDEAIALWIDDPTGRSEVVRVSPAKMETSTAAGRPAFWAVGNGVLQFERPLDAAYAFELRETCMLKLTDIAPTNSTLTAWPDLYLNGTLAEAAPFMIDDERMKIFEPKFVLALEEVSQHANRNRAKTPLRVDTRGLQGRRRFNVYTGR